MTFGEGLDAGARGKCPARDANPVDSEGAKTTYLDSRQQWRRCGGFRTDRGGN